jgi:hypothetical protein
MGRRIPGCIIDVKDRNCDLIESDLGAIAIARCYELLAAWYWYE